jgi:transposase
VQRLRPPPDPVVRYETEPGRQAQVDFAHCRLPSGIRYALVVVLGHSRVLRVQFYPRQDLRTLLHGLDACFTSWGGAPRELLFDQMRSVITRDERLTGGGLGAILSSIFNRWVCSIFRLCAEFGDLARLQG